MECRVCLINGIPYKYCRTLDATVWGFSFSPTVHGQLDQENMMLEFLQAFHLAASYQSVVCLPGEHVFVYDAHVRIMHCQLVVHEHVKLIQGCCHLVCSFRALVLLGHLGDI